ncbi:MAG TPA: DUF6445 family protein [Bacteriovoracaceae bacterium]|nr:DUF6445 family protein [Bacteriovoracaceae bacterium]
MQKSALERILDDEILVFDDFPTDFLLKDLRGRIFLPPGPRENFCGVVSGLDLPESQKLHQQLELLLGARLTDPDPDCARIRWTKKFDRPKSFVHCDPSTLVMTLYLSELPAGVRAEDFGTVFYQHRKTNWIRTDFKQAKSIIASNMIVKEDTNKMENWIVRRNIEFKKNRAVIYGGHLYHSPPLYFLEGTCPEERITMEYRAEFVRT